MKKLVMLAVLCGAVLGAGCATHQQVAKFVVPKRVVVNEGATIAVVFESKAVVEGVQIRIAGIDTNVAAGVVK